MRVWQRLKRFQLTAHKHSTKPQVSVIDRNESRTNVSSNERAEKVVTSQSGAWKWSLGSSLVIELDQTRSSRDVRISCFDDFSDCYFLNNLVISLARTETWDWEPFFSTDCDSTQIISNIRTTTGCMVDYLDQIW